MNYLHLGHSERFDEYYIVISDTTALRRSQPDPDLSGVSKLADTHPAMLQLSFGNAVHSEQSPRIVLVIGRIVRIMRFSFLPDHELHSALLAAWELSKLDKPENHEALDEIVHKTSVFLGIETKAGTDPTDFQVCYGDYLMEIARGLAAGLDIQKVLQQPSTEKARRDRWEHILRQSRGHEFTGFVAAVDAAGPTHRICAIHQCDRDVIRSADVGTSPTGGPVNLFEMNSGDPFTIYEGQDSTTYIMCVKEWASGNQMDSMDLYSRIKDGMACGRLLVRPVTVTELQRYLADHKNDSDETVRAGTQDLPTREIY